MSSTKPDITTLTRREIEAKIAGPLIRAFAEELGEDKALEVARRAIEPMARESGAQLAEFVGGHTLEHFAKGLVLWSQGGALEFETLEQSAGRFSMNVTRCRYAEMYRDLGMTELGLVLSCGRDYAMIEGFNPRVKFSRTQTIMEGAPYCDFRYELDEE